MSYENGEVLCSYPPSQKLRVFLLTLPFTLFGLLVAGVATVGLISALAQVALGTLQDTEPLVTRLLALVCVAVPLLGFSAFFLSMYSDLRLSQKGIEIQVLYLWWVLLPWENVLDIRTTLVSILMGHRHSQVVVVQRLTFLHRGIGWIYAQTLKPAFIIRGTQRGYNDAVRLIRERLGEREALSATPSTTERH